MFCSQEYSKALAYVRSFLQVEPGNQQVQHLETLIKKKMEKGFLFIIYYWLREIRIITYSDSILLQSAHSIISRSVYFMLFLTVLVFSWIGSYYIPLS